MLVVQIRVVRVRMGEWSVSMWMGMRFARGIVRGMNVLMVLVMNMGMLVLHRFVLMQVLVMFREV